MIALFLFCILSSNWSIAQDSLRAIQYKKDLIKNNTGNAFTRRDIINDTLTFYFYHSKSKGFIMASEWEMKKNALIYQYFFDSSGLRMAVVWQKRKFKKDMNATYYFENNTLYYKESTGLPLNHEEYLLFKGNKLYKIGPTRYEGPKFN